MLKSLPNLLILITFKSSTRFPANLIGPSAIGLKKILLDSLYTAIHPVLLQIAILYSSPLTIMDSFIKELIP